MRKQLTQNSRKRFEFFCFIIAIYCSKGAVPFYWRCRAVVCNKVLRCNGSTTYIILVCSDNQFVQ
jgi:hypothetical protein